MQDHQFRLPSPTLQVPCGQLAEFDVVSTDLTYGFGAFLFLVPFLLKKPLWSYRLATWTWGLITGGVATFWLDGFISHYAPLYTLYLTFRTSRCRYGPPLWGSAVDACWDV